MWRDIQHPSVNDQNDFGPMDCLKCCGSSCSALMIVISTIAIAILGCLAITGVIGGANLGWITLGLGAGLILLGGIGGLSGHKRLFGACFTGVFFVIIGALGGVGILSSANLGWAMISPILLTIGCSYLASYGTSSIGVPLAFLAPKRFSRLMTYISQSNQS